MPRIDTSVVSIEPSQKPSRGFEPHVDKWDSPNTPKRQGNGPRGFMAHSGPEATGGLDKGPFSSRTKLTSKP